MDALETIETDTLIGELHYDLHCSNPRDDEDPDCKFLFLGLPHRNYKIGDETIDPSTFSIECPACSGNGERYDGETGHHPDELCSRCEGEGSLFPRNMVELEEFIQIHYNPRLLFKVGMGEHSGRWFYLGGGASQFDPGGWDSGTCGFIMITQANLVARGGETWANEKTDDELIDFLKSEIQEYEDWSEGRCYGYIIYEKCGHGDDCCRSCDGKGEEVDSCWGFIGDYGEEAMKEAMDILTKFPEDGKVTA